MGLAVACYRTYYNQVAFGFGGTCDEIRLRGNGHCGGRGGSQVLCVLIRALHPGFSMLSVLGSGVSHVAGCSLSLTCRNWGVAKLQGLQGTGGIHVATCYTVSIGSSSGDHVAAFRFMSRPRVSLEPWPRAGTLYHRAMFTEQRLSDDELCLRL